MSGERVKKALDRIEASIPFIENLASDIDVAVEYRETERLQDLAGDLNANLEMLVEDMEMLAEAMDDMSLIDKIKLLVGEMNLTDIEKMTADIEEWLPAETSWMPLLARIHRYMSEMRQK